MPENQITAEEMLTTLSLFFLKRPKGILILIAIVTCIVGIMYFSFIRSQNEVLISSLSILKDMSVISDNANKRVSEIERVAKDVLEVATKAQGFIEEKICKLEEVEKKFMEKRELIQKLREENDALLQELKSAVHEANENLGRISEQKDKAVNKVHEIDVQQKMLKSMIR